MLRIIHCHGTIHSNEKSPPYDLIVIVIVPNGELSERPLTGAEVMKHAVFPKIASLACFGEDNRLSKDANDLYPLLKHAHGEMSAIERIHAFIERASKLHQQTRRQAFPKTPLSEATA